jgi:hypothetical protein
MTAEAQLDFVEKHFRPFTGRLQTIEDTYMAVLLPKAVGKGRDFVLFERASTILAIQTLGAAWAETHTFPIFVGDISREAAAPSRRIRRTRMGARSICGRSGTTAHRVRRTSTMHRTITR